MVEVLYATDSMEKAVDFIYSLVSDLQKFGIRNIQHDREHNLIIVGDAEIRGICVYESNITHGIRNIKYFIDDIDMKNYKNESEKQIDSLIYHVKEIMSHFGIDAKQLAGKDELIEILVGD